MNGDVPVKSLKKALDLLSVLLFQDGEEKGFAVKELGERLGLPANSVHNLLKTMAVCGYAEKNADGRYTYGPVCRQIASDLIRIHMSVIAFFQIFCYGGFSCTDPAGQPDHRDPVFSVLSVPVLMHLRILLYRSCFLLQLIPALALVEVRF
mgnify:CR=1 FL=1